MKYILVLIFLFFNSCIQAQNIKPKLEVYAAPGFFFEQLSGDSLVPPEKRNHARLGDISSFVLQAAVPLKNQRWLIKGGVGFSQRHYSLSKYSIGDFITSLFLFDSPSAETVLQSTMCVLPIITSRFLYLAHTR